MTEQNGFHGLGIAPKLMEILEKNNFTTPTPIQRQAIPIAIEGKDVVGIAQTGTGKTLAFGIPMLQRLVITKKKGLILLPTRELAIQVSESLTRIGRPLGLKTAILIGGESMGRQIAALRQDPHILIATPGRLIDLLESKKTSLAQTGVLVLDEADRMLDMGFSPQLKRILTFLPKERQTMLFSATMDGEMSGIAAAYLTIPMRIEVAPQGSTAAQISQEIIMVSRDEKPQLLQKVLTENVGSSLIFTRTKHGATKIAKLVRSFGHTSAEIHSNRSLNQRLEALNGFKIGKYRVLVATDIAARGIDVSNIELVVNYDLPEQSADYVHRIGRTGRAGKTGKAISFATSDQRSDVRDIERLIKRAIPVSRAEGLPARSASHDDAGKRTEFGGERRSNSRGGYDGDRPARNGGSRPPLGGSRSSSSRPPSRGGYGNSDRSSAPSGSGYSSRPPRGGGSRGGRGGKSMRYDFKPVRVGTPQDRGFTK
jgi:ATP-dependent RNA helicase RhlE